MPDQPPPSPRHTESSILQSYLLNPSPLPTIVPYSSFLQLIPAQHRSHPHLKRLYRDLQFQRTIDVDTVRQNILREVSRSAGLKASLARAIEGELNGVASVVNDTDHSASTRKRKRSRNQQEDSDDQSSDLNKDVDEFNDPIAGAIDTTYLTSSLHPSHKTLASNPRHPLTSATQTHHTHSSLITALQATCTDLQAEIAEYEAEATRLMTETEEIVGSLSDLRYGRFAKPVGGDQPAAGSGTGEAEERTVEDEVLQALDGLERRLRGTGAVQAL